MSIQVMITNRTATFQGELQTAGLMNVNSLPLHQGDLWLPCFGGDFAMGPSLIQGVLPWAASTIHETGKWVALACSTKHMEDIH